MFFSIPRTLILITVLLLSWITFAQKNPKSLRGADGQPVRQRKEVTIDGGAVYRGLEPDQKKRLMEKSQFRQIIIQCRQASLTKGNNKITAGEVESQKDQCIADKISKLPPGTIRAIVKKKGQKSGQRIPEIYGQFDFRHRSHPLFKNLETFLTKRLQTGL
ncbi:hypothetical protein OAB57_00635, partial [Bacteriovoracaceae bacterium]|nr:hypothetical protein [Bacteriovoracaceae bacterium]